MLRHSATRSPFERRDVIVVASISVSMALAFSEYLKAAVKFEVETLNIRGQLWELVNNHSRNDTEIARGRFRMKGGAGNRPCLRRSPVSANRSVRR